MSEPAPGSVRFGVFEVDLRAGELRKRGVKVRLQHQPFRILEAMLERPGQVVTREELRLRLWPSDTFVDFDHGLNKAVNKLREVLGDTAESPRFIETLPKRGYRFIAPLDTPAAAPVAAVTAPVAIEPPPPPMPVAAPVAAPERASDRSRWPVFAGLAAVAMAVAVAAMFWPRGPADPAAPAATERLMLAVLPFVNIDRNPDQEYFADGLTDEMIVEVSRLRPDRLGVIARTSASHYRNSGKRVDEIARELGVGYVLEGTVRRSGSRVRISANLIQARDQTPLWAELYDRDVSDVMAIQVDVARRIASALALELLPDQQLAMARAARPASDAYDAYLRGRYHFNKRTPADLQTAVAHFTEAVAKDATFVAAHAGLADALNVMPYYGLMRPRDAYPKSQEAARRALELDDRSAAAHTALAYSLHYYEWDWPAAEREYARALEINPSFAQARQWRAAHYSELGRTDEALAEIRQAQRLDPMALISRAAEGWINYHGRRYETAEDLLKRTLALDPDFVPARLWLGFTYEATGRPEEAISEFQHVRKLSGAAPTGMGELAHGLGQAGRKVEAHALVEQLLAIARERYIEADLLARVYAGVGDRDKAFEWLEKGFEERAVKMVSIGVDPLFDPLRDDPRFQALLKRLNLPERPPAPR